MKTRVLFVFVLILGSLVTRAEVIPFDLSPPGHGNGLGLSPLNEVIPPASTGSGNEIGGAGILFDTTSRTLTFSIGYGSYAGFTDLTGPAFSWLLHGPAGESETAPVVFDLAPFQTFAPNHANGGTIVGSLSYSTQQAADLMAGFQYINIYTELNLGGELRGQLVPVPEPGVIQIMLCFAAACLAFRHARSK